MNRATVKNASWSLAISLACEGGRKEWLDEVAELVHNASEARFTGLLTAGRLWAVGRADGDSRTGSAVQKYTHQLGQLLDPLVANAVLLPKEGLIVGRIAPWHRVLAILLLLGPRDTASCIEGLGLVCECASGAMVRSTAAPQSRLAALTKREYVVAQLLVQGFTDLNVAAHLAISEDTVGTHARRIFRKLGVHSRAELAYLFGRSP